MSRAEFFAERRRARLRRWWWAWTNNGRLRHFDDGSIRAPAVVTMIECSDTLYCQVPR